MKMNRAEVVVVGAVCIAKTICNSWCCILYSAICRVSESEIESECLAHTRDGENATEHNRKHSKRIKNYKIVTFVRSTSGCVKLWFIYTLGINSKTITICYNMSNCTVHSQWERLYESTRRTRTTGEWKCILRVVCSWYNTHILQIQHSIYLNIYFTIHNAFKFSPHSGAGACSLLQSSSLCYLFAKLYIVSFVRCACYVLVHCLSKYINIVILCAIW